MNISNTQLAAIGGIGLVVVGIVMSSDDGQEQPTVVQRVVRPLSTAADQAQSSDGPVPDPFNINLAGGLDAAAGNIDETVGGAVSGAAGSLGPGPAQFVDSVTDQDTAQAAARSLFPSVAIAETGVDAANDILQ